MKITEQFLHSILKISELLVLNWILVAVYLTETFRLSSRKIQVNMYFPVFALPAACNIRGRRFYNVIKDEDQPAGGRLFRVGHKVLKSVMFYIYFESINLIWPHFSCSVLCKTYFWNEEHMLWTDTNLWQQSFATVFCLKTRTTPVVFKLFYSALQFSFTSQVTNSWMWAFFSLQSMHAFHFRCNYFPDFEHSLLAALS